MMLDNDAAGRRVNGSIGVIESIELPEDAPLSVGPESYMGRSFLEIRS